MSNVVAVHCSTGKGRSATVICCYLLYSGRFNTTQEVLNYYQKKRYNFGGGICSNTQIRYITYFEKILNDFRITP